MDVVRLLLMCALSGIFVNGHDTLKVAVNILPPFTILTNGSLSKGKYHLVNKNQITGLEMEMFTTLTQPDKFNFQYHARVFDEDIYYGRVYRNGTTTGLFHDLEIGTFDIAIGYIKNIRNLKKHFDVTNAWIFDEMLYCCQKDYINYQWKIIFNMFTVPLHFFSALWTAFHTWLFWKLSSKQISILESVHLSIKLFLGHPVKLPNIRFQRLAVFALIIFQTFISIFYQSKWMVQLGDHKSGFILNPDNINYFFENRFKLFYNPYDQDYFRDIKEYQVLHNSEECFGHSQCIQKILDNSKSYTLLSQLLMLYLEGTNNFGSPERQLRCVLENQYIHHELIFLFRKNHSLTNLINNRLWRMQALGIIEAKKRKFLRPIPKMQMVVVGRELSIKHIMPIVYFLFFGYVFAIACFVIEICYFYLRNWITV